MKKIGWIDEPGLRDKGLLESALAKPRQQYHRHGHLLSAGIVRKHPFADGNKRTGFVVGILFLELNGYRFTASHEDAVNAHVVRSKKLGHYSVGRI